MHALRIVILLLWAGFWLYWLLSAQNVKSDAKRDTGAARVVQLVLSLLSYALLIPLFWYWSPLLAHRIVRLSFPLLLVGLGLLALGLAFAVWARVHLSVYWSGRVTIKEDHKLIQTGPYAVVRNPIYTGLIAAVIGTALLSPQVHSAAAILLFVAAMVVKIKTEEQFLIEAFGDDYRAYRKRVRSLVPFVV